VLEKLPHTVEDGKIYKQLQHLKNLHPPQLVVLAIENILVFRLFLVFYAKIFYKTKNKISLNEV
jgi:hypothetical protein